MPVRACLLGFALMLAVVLPGCKKGEEAKQGEPAPAVVQAVDNNGKVVQARPTSRTKLPPLLPFKDAVIWDDAAPRGELGPPDFTCTGKKTSDILLSIANELWDKADFTDGKGNRVRYQATIKTELGDIQIDLLGDAAPNHVRNFVCLSKAGYYDGMSFYYSLHRQIEDFPTGYIETGCPRGTREFGSGSIGYWLRPEHYKQLTHEAGVLGACLNEDPNSAACRFYLTSIAMPQMDAQNSFTIFGKVTQGLDIVRAINRREVRDADFLRQPVLIRSVTIQTTPD